MTGLLVTTIVILSIMFVLDVVTFVKLDEYPETQGLAILHMLPTILAIVTCAVAL